MSITRRLGLLLLLLLFCFACNAGGKNDAEARGAGGVPEAQEDKPLQIVLSEGKEPDPAAL
ncbi:MAG: hypothetical protein WC314_27740, partial [Vulcanimicrobiota bacterium]